MMRMMLTNCEVSTQDIACIDEPKCSGETTLPVAAMHERCVMPKLKGGWHWFSYWFS